MRSILGLAFLFFLSAATALPQNLGPTETVRAFYKFSNARSSIFSKRHIELRKQWYTPHLYKAFLEQLQEDQTHLKKHPTDKPFFGDGLAFRPLDEACEANGKHYSRYQTVTRTDIQRSRAYVDVTFAYPKACTTDTESIVYRVDLRRINGKWLIDDWTYSDGSTLTRDMREHKYN